MDILNILSLIGFCLSIAIIMLGLIACAIPIIPGHLIIMTGIIINYLLYPGQITPLSWWTWVILSLITIFSFIVDNILTGVGAKKFGGSTKGIIGAVIGLFIGGFFFPFGIILGPFLGALIFEIIWDRKEIKTAVSAGIGATLGNLASMVAKVILGIVLVTYYIIAIAW